VASHGFVENRVGTINIVGWSLPYALSNSLGHSQNEAKGQEELETRAQIVGQNFNLTAMAVTTAAYNGVTTLELNIQHNMEELQEII